MGDHGHKIVVAHVADTHLDMMSVESISPGPVQISQVGLAVGVERYVVIGQAKERIGVEIVVVNALRTIKDRVKWIHGSRARRLSGLHTSHEQS